MHVIEIFRDMSVAPFAGHVFATVRRTVGHALLTFAEVGARLGVTAKAGELLALDLMTPVGPLRMSTVWGDERDAAIWRLEAHNLLPLPWLAGVMGDAAAFVEWAIDDPAKPSFGELAGAYVGHINLRHARMIVEAGELRQVMLELSQCLAPATDRTRWSALEELPTGGWYEPQFRASRWALAAWRRLRAGAAPKWPARPAAGLEDMVATVQWLAHARGQRHAWLLRAHPRRDFRLYGEYVAVLRALARLAETLPATPSGGMTVVRRGSSAAIGVAEPFGGRWDEQPDRERAALAYGEFLLRRLTGLDWTDELWKLHWHLSDEVFVAVVEHADSAQALRRRLVRIATVRTRYADVFAAGARPAAAQLLQAHAETLQAIADM